MVKKEVQYARKHSHLPQPESVVLKFVVTGHCNQTTRTSTQRIKYLNSCITPNLKAKLHYAVIFILLNYNVKLLMRHLMT